jgi:hypothetical protein
MDGRMEGGMLNLLLLCLILQASASSFGKKLLSHKDAVLKNRRLMGTDSADKVDSTNTADVADKAEWGPFGSNAFASVRQWRPCWTCCFTSGGSILLLSLTVLLSASTCWFFKSWSEGS